MHVGMQPNRRTQILLIFAITIISNSLTLIALTIIGGAHVRNRLNESSLVRAEQF